MRIETVDSSFVKEISHSFSARDVTDLAKRLGVRGHGDSWEEILSMEERMLRFSGIGQSTLNKLDRFREILAEKAKTSVEMTEHNVKYVIYGKSQYYRYGLYLVDGTPISFPSSYSNQNIIWLLKGDGRCMPEIPEAKKSKMIKDIENDVRFLSNHFDLGLEFRKDEGDGVKYLTVKVPQKTKVA